MAAGSMSLAKDWSSDRDSAYRQQSRLWRSHIGAEESIRSSCARVHQAQTKPSRELAAGLARQAKASEQGNVPAASPTPVRTSITGAADDTSSTQT